MSINNYVSIVVTTSFKYKELIDGFIYFFEKYWADCDYEIYISLEKEKRLNKNNFKFITSMSDDWSTRLFYTLKLVDSELILLMLDDYYIFDFVDSNIITSSVNEMQKNSIDHLSFFSSDYFDRRVESIETISNEYKLYLYKSDFMNYIANVVCGGLYNKKSLMQIIRKDETAWEFETFASLRSIIDKNFISARMVYSCNPLKFVDGGVIKKGRIRDEALEQLNKEKFNLVFTEKSIQSSNGNVGLLFRFYKKIIRIYKNYTHIIFGKLK